MQLQSCTHVFVNIDGDVAYDDSLLEVTIFIRLCVVTYWFFITEERTFVGQVLMVTSQSRVCVEYSNKPTLQKILPGCRRLNRLFCLTLK